jgi:chaperone modulatory protein CbpM
MNNESSQIVWLDARCEVTLGELVQLSGLSEADLHEMVEFGALVPTRPGETQWTFSGECVLRIQAAGRLRDDFGLDTNALMVALKLLDRIRTLEDDLRALRAQLPAHRT